MSKSVENRAGVVMASVFSSERIHPTAVVHPQAELHPTVVVGPYSVIGEHVRIGADTVVGPQVVIDGWTTLGERNRIFPGAALGLEPQDLKYSGAPSRVIIGNDNRIRECVTINRATQEGEATILGDDNLLMAYVHVGHNCVIGDQVVITNSVALAGHVHIESQARLGGMVGLHQFTRVGRLAMLGAMARIDRDVPPFLLAEGNPGRLRGLNLVGLKRAGWKTTDELRQLKEAYRLLYRSNLTLERALQELSSWTEPHIVELVAFLTASQAPGRRGPLPSQRE